MTMTLGCDVSWWQGPNTQYGPIDWVTLTASDCKFAFIRACWKTYEDQNFSINWPGSGDAGILRGGYLYFDPSWDPVAQADKLFDLTQGVGELPDVIDFETNPANYQQGTLRNRIDICRDHYAQLAGREPILYTNLSWLGVLGDSLGMDLWIARYYATEPGVDDWQFWQDSDRESFPGIADPTVDRNWFNGTYDDLLVYCGLQEPPPSLEERVSDLERRVTALETGL